MYIIRYTALGVSCGVIYHIQREASALLVQHRWAIPEPQIVGRVTVMGSHAFLYKSNIYRGAIDGIENENPK